MHRVENFDGCAYNCFCIDYAIDNISAIAHFINDMETEISWASQL